MRTPYGCNCFAAKGEELCKVYGAEWYFTCKGQDRSADSWEMTPARVLGEQPAGCRAGKSCCRDLRVERCLKCSSAVTGLMHEQ